MRTLECFTAATCAPCRVMKRDLAEWKDRPADLQIRYVAVDEPEGKRLADLSGVVVLPSLRLLEDGVPVSLVEGWSPGAPGKVLASLLRLAANPRKRAELEADLLDCAAEVAATEEQAAAKRARAVERAAKAAAKKRAAAAKKKAPAKRRAK